VGAQGPIGAGATASIGNNGEMSITDFLHSGSMTAEVQVVVTASNGGLFENCDAIGEATLVSS
jgi:hypothetical protein